MGSKVRNEIVEELPSYYNMDYAVLGSFSLTTREVKYVALEDAITENGTTDTPPYHFRRSLEEYQFRTMLFLENGDIAFTWILDVHIYNSRLGSDRIVTYTLEEQLDMEKVYSIIRSLQDIA